MVGRQYSFSSIALPPSIPCLLVQPAGLHGLHQRTHRFLVTLKKQTLFRHSSIYSILKFYLETVRFPERSCPHEQLPAVPCCPRPERHWRRGAAGEAPGPDWLVVLKVPVVLTVVLEPDWRPRRCCAGLLACGLLLLVAGGADGHCVAKLVQAAALHRHSGGNTAEDKKGNSILLL